MDISLNDWDRDRMRPLVAAYFVTQLGSWASLVALWGTASFELGRTALEISAVALVWSLPAALAGRAPGNLVARFGASRVLVVGGLLGAAAATSLALNHGYTMALAMGLVLGVVKALIGPALDAVPPIVLTSEHWDRANSRLVASNDAAMVGGPAVAAILFSVSGVGSVFLFDALSYLLGVALIRRARIGGAPPGRTTDPTEPFLHGEVGPDKELSVSGLLVFHLGIYLTWAVFLALEPVYIRERLGMGSAFFSVLQAGYAATVVLVSLVLPRLVRRSWRLLLVGGGVSGLGAALYVATPIAAVAVLGIAVWAVGNAVATVFGASSLQAAVGGRARFRTLALNRALNAWCHVIMLPLAGVLVGLLGPSGVGVGTAVIAACLSTVVAHALHVRHGRAVRAKRIDTGRDRLDTSERTSLAALGADL